MKNLRQMIIDKGEIPGKIIEIDEFSLDCGYYGNLKCALVINKVLWYALRFVAYDINYKKLEENLLIRKSGENWTLKGAKESSTKFKNILISKQFINDFYSYKMISAINYFRREFKISKNDKPDDYLRPLDIVKRKISISGNYHFAIYLGDKTVCHISSGENEDIYDNSKNIVNLPSLINSSLISKMSARIDDWKNFLKNESEIICYHSLVHIKKPLDIVNHLRKAIEGEYGKGQYEIVWNNCEHFVNLINYNMKYSKQSSDYLSSSFLRMMPPPEGISAFEESVEKQINGEVNHRSFEIKKKRDLLETEKNTLISVENYFSNLN